MDKLLEKIAEKIIKSKTTNNLNICEKVNKICHKLMAKTLNKYFGKVNKNDN